MQTTHTIAANPEYQKSIVKACIKENVIEYQRYLGIIEEQYIEIDECFQLLGEYSTLDEARIIHTLSIAETNDERGFWVYRYMIRNFPKLLNDQNCLLIRQKAIFLYEEIFKLFETEITPDHINLIFTKAECQQKVEEYLTQHHPDIHIPLEQHLYALFEQEPILVWREIEKLNGLQVTDEEFICILTKLHVENFLRQAHKDILTDANLSIIQSSSVFIDRCFMRLHTHCKLDEEHIIQVLAFAATSTMRMQRIYLEMIEQFPQLLNDEMCATIKAHPKFLRQKMDLVEYEASVEGIKAIFAEAKEQEIELFPLAEDKLSTHPLQSKLSYAMLGFFGGALAMSATLYCNPSVQTFLTNLLSFMPHAAAMGVGVAACGAAIALLALAIHAVMNNHVKQANVTQSAAA